MALGVHGRPGVLALKHAGVANSREAEAVTTQNQQMADWSAPGRLLTTKTVVVKTVPRLRRASTNSFVHPVGLLATPVRCRVFRKPFSVIVQPIVMTEVTRTPPTQGVRICYSVSQKLVLVTFYPWLCFV